jgi:regulator of telomere elongation helicase 1
MLFNDNIDIALPAGFEPYPAQRAVISAALSALTSSTHALLESPTGTGKSLALLCATLGFAAHYRTEELKRLIEQHHPEAAEGSLADLEATGFADKLKEEIPVPRIWYATRTHSQVAHLVNELRRTPYRPKITVLASREQYCINSVVISNATALSHGNKNTACKEAVEKGRCHYFRNVAMLRPADGEILDVEDIVSRGRRLQACPYYASRYVLHVRPVLVCS